jgi:hypothetical protein
MTLGLSVTAYLGSRFIAIWFNYWTSFLPMMLGVLAENLYDEHRKSKNEQKESASSGQKGDHTPADSKPADLALSPAASAESSVSEPSDPPSAREDKMTAAKP